jgi:hypothetical protein
MSATERFAMHPPAGKEPQIPAENSGPAVANPPPLPQGEIQPEEIIEQNEEATAPPPILDGTRK